MPGYDKTGPEGKGSLTGRGLGGCTSKDFKQLKDMGYMDKIPNKPNRGRGRGFGPGKGFGRNTIRDSRG